MSVTPPCMHCGARRHADYEDGLIECRDRLAAHRDEEADRADVAEARVKALADALETYVVADEHIYGVGHTERSAVGRAALKGGAS